MDVYYTKGLPDGTHADTTYHFTISENTTEHFYSIMIPGNYVGRDQIGDPTYPEQVAWLNGLKTQLHIEEVWYGTWTITGEADYATFKKIIAPYQ